MAQNTNTVYTVLTFRFVRLFYQLHVLCIFFLFINTSYAHYFNDKPKRLLIMYHNDGLQKLKQESSFSSVQSMQKYNRTNMSLDLQGSHFMISLRQMVAQQEESRSKFNVRVSESCFPSTVVPFSCRSLFLLLFPVTSPPPSIQPALCSWQLRLRGTASRWRQQPGRFSLRLLILKRHSSSPSLASRSWYQVAMAFSGYFTVLPGIGSNT